MDDEELRETLQKLHSELENAGEMDEESARLLKHLQEDIQAHLESEEEPTAGEYESLMEVLRKNIQHFEIVHPTLVMTMGQALSILSESGI